MTDPLIHEILSTGQALGKHPGALVLEGEGSVAARMTDTRMVVSRVGADLAGLVPTDFVHFDLQRFNEVNAQETILPEDLAATRLHAAPGAEPQEDAPLFGWLLALEPAVRVAAHIHPVVVDQITASPRARQFADRRTVHNEVLLLGAASLLVNYSEPGLPLTREIQKKMVLWRDRYKSVPRVILVQNHGVILLGETGPGLLRCVDGLLKYAELFTNASLLGGPVFLTPQAITQIESSRRGA